MHKRARMQERGDLMVLQERVRLSALERAMEQARQRRAQADLNALKQMEILRLRVSIILAS